MSLPVKLAEVAFKLHKEDRIDKDKLVSLLETCVNIAALENGYAEEHGLPFPEGRRKRKSRYRQGGRP